MLSWAIRNKEGHEPEEPARRAVGRQEEMESRRRTTWKNVLKPAYIYIIRILQIGCAKI
jgi:hypothetical protein